jgi:hypothetical protein
MDAEWIVSFFYKKNIHVTHLLYISIFYIIILCYSILFWTLRYYLKIMQGVNYTYEKKVRLVANPASSTQHV